MHLFQKPTTLEIGDTKNTRALEVSYEYFCLFCISPIVRALKVPLNYMSTKCANRNMNTFLYYGSAL